MKSKSDEVKEFLRNRLKREDLSPHHRTSIEGTLSFLMDEEKAIQKEWEDFVSSIIAKKEAWSETYQVEGFHYEVSTFVDSYSDLHTVTLNLKNGTYSTWVFEIHVFPERKETYFSSIQEEVDEFEVSSFTEVNGLMDNVFESEDFRSLVKNIKNVFG